MDRKTLIQGTINSIVENIESLRFEHERIGADIGEKQKLLEVWRRELASLEKGETRSRTGERLRKGEPLRKINAAFDTFLLGQQQGLTVKEIAKATSIGWTTVRNVVRGEKNGFVDVGDGKWRRSADIEKEKQRRLKLATAS